jgi:hypothetical protein
VDYTLVKSGSLQWSLNIVTKKETKNAYRFLVRKSFMSFSREWSANLWRFLGRLRWW